MKGGGKRKKTNNNKRFVLKTTVFATRFPREGGGEGEAVFFLPPSRAPFFERARKI